VVRGPCDPAPHQPHGDTGGQADLPRFLDRAARRQGALVMIGSEPGAGKIRLAETLC
jgi:hypothetical protein